MAARRPRDGLLTTSSRSPTNLLNISAARHLGAPLLSFTCPPLSHSQVHVSLDALRFGGRQDFAERLPTQGTLHFAAEWVLEKVRPPSASLRRHAHPSLLASHGQASHLLIQICSLHTAKPPPPLLIHRCCRSQSAHASRTARCGEGWTKRPSSHSHRRALPSSSHSHRRALPSSSHSKVLGEEQMSEQALMGVGVLRVNLKRGVGLKVTSRPPAHMPDCQPLTDTLLSLPPSRPPTGTARAIRTSRCRAAAK